MDQPALPTDTSSSRPGQGHHGIGGQCLLMAQPVPVAAAVRLGAIGKIGLVPVAHIEKATQETHPPALDPVPQQGGGRHLEILARQIQQRRFDGGVHVDAGTEVKGLLPPHIVLDVGGKPVSDLLEGIFVGAKAGVLHKVLRILQRLGNLLSAGDLSQAGAAVGVGEDHCVAGKVGGVGAGQVELHAVQAGRGEDLHLSHFRGICHI
ncbi:MAG: hypothetical protein ACLSE7_02045 [Lachnospirales bacterium]